MLRSVRLAAAGTIIVGASAVFGCDKREVVSSPKETVMADSMFGVAHDLYVEVYSRSLHQLYNDGRLTQPDNPNVPRITPEMDPPDVARPRPEDVMLDTTSAARARRARVTVTFSNPDVGRVGLNQWMREAGFTVRTTGGSQSADPTNTLLAGDSVNLNDLKSLVLQSSLLGLPIRRIRMLSDSTKAFEIQMQALHHVASYPALSTAEIRELQRPTPH